VAGLIYFCNDSRVVQVANTAGTQQPVFTTEVFPTAVPVTLTTNGITSTVFVTVTSSRVVQATPTSRGGGNGSGNPQQNLNSSKKNIGAIAGGITGAVVAVALIVALVFCFLRRRRRIRQEIDISRRIAIPYPDLFRPSPGTGWDVESPSNRSSSASTSSGPFVKPMSQTAASFTVHRKPVPTVSEDPFWDPSQQLDRIPIIPVQARRVQVEDAPPAHDPFADPPPRLAPFRWEGGPSRLSTASTMFDATSQSSFVVPVSRTLFYNPSEDSLTDIFSSVSLCNLNN
jgi:hypothetical protein